MSTIKEILYGTQPVFRKNFIQENIKHLRDMQSCCHTNRAAGFSATRSGSVRCLSSKPRSESAHPGGRDRTAKSIDRQLTTISSNINILKKQLNEKAVCKNGSGTLPLHHVKCSGARCRLQREKVVVTHKTEPNKINQQNSNLTKITNCRHLVTGKDQASNSTNVTSLPSVTMYKDGSSQTLETQDIDELYKEGAIVYPSSNVLTKERDSGNKPILIDSANQTDSAQNSVDVSELVRDVPFNEVYSDDVDCLNVQAINIDDCKENVQDQCNITANSRKSSSKQKRASTPSDSLKAPPSYQKGVVPRYLRERQQQWQKAVEEELANAPDPSCPAGHVLLPEEERKQTLDMINKDYASMVRELNMMPVRTDTLRLRQRKIELEQKLTKLEEASKVFSRPKVFVKVGV